MPSEAAEDTAPAVPLRGWGKRFGSFLFDSLQGRFVLAMVGGLALVQLAVNLVWYSQIEQRVRRQTELAAHHVASGAIGAVRALRELPAAYRPLLIEQLRTMGGTRFLVFFNNAAVPVAPLPDQPMARLLEQQVTQELAAQLPQLSQGSSLRVVLASPSTPIDTSSKASGFVHSSPSAMACVTAVRGFVVGLPEESTASKSAARRAQPFADNDRGKSRPISDSTPPNIFTPSNTSNVCDRCSSEESFAGSTANMHDASDEPHGPGPHCVDHFTEETCPRECSQVPPRLTSPIRTPPNRPRLGNTPAPSSAPARPWRQGRPSVSPA